jgi:hypothetical protein
MSQEVVLPGSEIETDRPAVEPDLTVLRAIADSVRLDSRIAPDEYLDESTVPYGGE